MLAFPSMIADYAREAGMEVPDDEDLRKTNDSFDSERFPHFRVFCTMQLGVAMDMGQTWDVVEHNAKIIAGIPEAKIRKVTAKQLRKLGWWEKIA